MTTAETTREQARTHPYLIDALRDGIVNYAAAARTLDVSADTDAVATALRRYATDLPPRTTTSHDVRVTITTPESPTDNPLSRVPPDTRENTATEPLTHITATGDIPPRALEHILGLCHTHRITPVAASATPDRLVLVVDRADAATALRLTETGFQTTPD